MDANRMCSLLAQRIDSSHFQVWGFDVHWMNPEYDTPENRAIVADVMTNYETLSVAYEAEQKARAENDEIKATLAEIDLKSIRPLREWVAQQPGAPQLIKDYESAASAERAKLDIK